MGSWTVWFHPVRSARHIEELEDEIITLRTLADRQTESLSQMESDMAELRRHGAEQRLLMENDRTELEQLRAEVGKLRTENAEMSKELKEWEELRPELEKVGEAMEKMESIKAGYKAKIAKLKQSLEDARRGRFRRREVEGADDELFDPSEWRYCQRPVHAAPEQEPIDMTANDVATGAAPHPAIPAKRDNQGPGKSSRQMPLPRKYADHRPTSADDSDWLKPLPE